MNAGIKNTYDVVVIGGGLAGLSAAVECVSAGRSVLLVEQKPHFGGRTYSFRHAETGDDVDNGQHLMMGCYFATLNYLKKIGAEKKIEVQKNLSILFRRENNQQFRLSAALLPSPLHILIGLLKLKSLSIVNRLKLLRVGAAIMFANPENNSRLHALTVAQWLNSLYQPEENKKYLWNIIAIGTLNDSPEKISAALFVKVLKRVFFWRRIHSSMVIPKFGLSPVLIDPAVKFIREHRGDIVSSVGAEKITFQNTFVSEILLKTGERIVPKTVICTVPYFDIPKVFSPEQIALIPQLHNLDKFHSPPIVTIHLWFNKHFVPEKFASLMDSPLHWVFNKTKIYDASQEGLMYLAVVVSGAFELVPQTKEEITALVHKELIRFYPEAADAEILHSLIIKEKRATFSPMVGMEYIRPSHATSISNLFLAGDWTNTKLPATIEGAIQSGVDCAALVLQKLSDEK
ncbi:MAG: FAD-dependent oxidoreductase [Bacteroidetes bacterium]|nr:FAD-dependent oxidoreductase [Bacteroidota bacterium]